MTYRTIEYSVDDAVATITLNRPQARNGFTTEMADELGAAFTEADRDDAVRAVIFAAQGRDFCVGMDLTAGGSDEDVTDPEWVEWSTRVVRPMTDLNKPVIVAMQGAAIGVGLSMTLAADFRLAATDSRFGFVFARRGLFPEGGSLWFLPRIVGLAKAKEWMITGRVFGADEALAAGLVTSLHDAEELLPAARALAAELTTQVAPVSVAAIRRGLVAMSGDKTPDDVFTLDARLISYAFASSDLREGIMSFLQKRPPHFTGQVATELPHLDDWLS
ncbi:enoyl-CoA hydratase-related protein [Nocardia alba]|uniref:Enoyl-CoA hydratase/carnithine racemase n=1 Tax=Nocardia alba TaxID=225051 RepID=A0A4R1FSI3_9NOCA|nr:enoyl-CoA hydratase-related protein [Nocardia alba]TCJ96602.1 enoyl-CoA hydratase/carnithine racemase [Nocardia alba]